MKKFLNRVMIAVSLMICAVATSVAAESIDRSLLMINVQAQTDTDNPVEFVNHDVDAVVNTVIVNNVKEAERLYNVRSDAHLTEANQANNVVALPKQRAWLDYTERLDLLAA